MVYTQIKHGFLKKCQHAQGPIYIINSDKTCMGFDQLERAQYIYILKGMKYKQRNQLQLSWVKRVLSADSEGVTLISFRKRHAKNILIFLLRSQGMSSLQRVSVRGFIAYRQSSLAAGTMCPSSSVRIHFNLRIIKPPPHVLEHQKKKKTRITLS